MDTTATPGAVPRTSRRGHPKCVIAGAFFSLSVSGQLELKGEGVGRSVSVKAKERKLGRGLQGDGKGATVWEAG